METITLSVGMIDTNCYLFWDPETRQGAVVDPGGSPQKILKTIKKENLDIAYIICTHGHFDHIQGLADVQEALRVPVMIHTMDADAIENPGKSLLHSNFGLMPGMRPVKADIVLQGGEVFELGNKNFRILHTPGHSRGSICVLTDNALFSGDTLFQGDIGRCDLYGGDYNVMLHTLATVINAIDSSPDVFPGHGPASELSFEKAHNPYILEAVSRYARGNSGEA